ncbi:MAG: aldo/keto reductase [Pikeienuella sp.]|uniref:aldo/keto reductase n=1 Tax=Pikeienuella sp. TaxID=2831957 RepID=UPI00391BD3BE
MIRRKIAGAEVGAVGYGAMSFSDFYGPASEESSFAILDSCLDLGVDHIDTSNVYGMGRSEERIGAWLKRRGGACPFHIATKGGITRDAAGNRRFDNSHAHLTEELEKSLKRMGLEAVDLYYVHRRDPEVPIEEVAETLAALEKSGKAKATGYSEIAPASLRRAHAVNLVAAVQSEYSLSTRQPELGLLQTCAELGVALVAFSPVGRGLLTDRPHGAEAVAKIDFLKGNPRFQEPNLSTNLALTDRFRTLAAQWGRPAASLAIGWLLAQGEHVIPIPGTRSPAHLREAAEALPLTPEEVAAVEAILPVGWAHGDRYNAAQWVGPERFC